MKFDPKGNNIICISYPTGGFGNFLYHILVSFAEETIDPTTISFSFSPTGDSHNIKMLSNIYFKDPEYYDPWIIVDHDDKSIPVLCDNGINNDQYTQLLKVFPYAKILRVIISPKVRPIIYQTYNNKALNVTLLDDVQDHLNANWQDSNENYAIRENYTLFYHNWPFKWEQIDGVINFNLEELIINPYNAIVMLFDMLGLTLINKEILINTLADWTTANQKYFKIYNTSNDILNALNTNQQIDISGIVDLHEQGYINYCIEQTYNVIIPVYDYKDWFKNTSEIKLMIEKLCSE